MNQATVAELNPIKSAEVVIGGRKDILGLPLVQVKEIPRADKEKLKGISTPSDFVTDEWREPRETVYNNVRDRLVQKLTDEAQRDKFLAEVLSHLKSPDEINNIYQGYLRIAGNESKCPGYSAAEVAFFDAAARVVAEEEAGVFLKDAQATLEQEAAVWVEQRKESIREQRGQQEELSVRYEGELQTLTAEVEGLEQAIKNLETGLQKEAEVDIAATKSKLSPYTDLMREWRNVIKKASGKWGLADTLREKAGQRGEVKPLEPDEMRFIEINSARNSNFLIEQMLGVEGQSLEVASLYRRARDEVRSLVNNQQVATYIQKNITSIFQVAQNSLLPANLDTEMYPNTNKGLLNVTVVVLLLHDTLPVKDPQVQTIIGETRNKILKDLTQGRLEEKKRDSQAWQEKGQQQEQLQARKNKKSHELSETKKLIRRGYEEENNLGQGNVIEHRDKGFYELEQKLTGSKGRYGVAETGIKMAVAEVASSLVLAKLANNALFYNNESSANYADRRPKRLGEIRKPLYEVLVSFHQADQATRNTLTQFFQAYDEVVKERYIEKAIWEKIQAATMKELLDGATIKSCQSDDRGQLLQACESLVDQSQDLVAIKAVPVEILSNNYRGPIPPKEMWLRKTGNGIILTTKYNDSYIHADIREGDSLQIRIAESLTDEGKIREASEDYPDQRVLQEIFFMKSRNALFLRPKLQTTA